jgi:hypothetical protein
MLMLRCVVMNYFYAIVSLAPTNNNRAAFQRQP